MPFVSIRLVKEVLADTTGAKKATVARKVADALSEAMGIPPKDVWVVFEEVEARNWYVGSDDVAKLKGLNQKK